jgi:hypothetical protein
MPTNNVSRINAATRGNNIAEKDGGAESLRSKATIAKPSEPVVEKFEPLDPRSPALFMAKGPSATKIETVKKNEEGKDDVAVQRAGQPLTTPKGEWVIKHDPVSRENANDFDPKSKTEREKKSRELGMAEVMAGAADRPAAKTPLEKFAGGDDVSSAEGIR